ncbi:ABC transporter ATP-binding protein [Herbiconiux sp. SYSU D00978]|uniref:ABC transporter ATP-binding protein n=1 Tax=Herbiconiux sp. SYSU D00978 TaxID=2812562 RepID=UPI001A974B3F|nr:ATP-binding cassette domain-containing protein [Herbiconiux sp. SYSU D00978]
MLKVDQVTKRFGERVALEGVSFEVGRGRLTGFVGGNGAGKTTTMRIILGVLGADSGSVTLDGTPLSAGDRRRFGYMPEERGLYPKMKVHEQLVYLARLHGIAAKQAATNAGDLLERLGLAERANDTVESLSLGNQQRAQIAAALVHDPEVLILDEPFSGLDPMAVEVVLSVLQDVARRGAPVLFSSHQLDVVERLCDDIVVIAGGTIRASGSRERLQAENRGSQYELLTGGDAAWVREVPGVTVLQFDAGYALFEADSAAAQTVLRHALELGPVASFAPKHPSLTQIFKEVVQ